MEINGKVFQILEKQTGKSAKGDWSKQEFVVETKGEYPRKICLVIWGDKIEMTSLKVGDDVTAQINLESREFNNKWFTDAKVWKIDKTSDVQNNTDKSTGNIEELNEENSEEVCPF